MARNTKSNGEEKAAPRDPEATRALLLQAAYREIHENGYRAASLERILRNTQVTKGALYHHFPNKQALGLAVVREVVKGISHEQFVAPLADADDPIAATLAMIQQRMDAFDAADMGLGCPLNNLVQEMSPVDEAFRKRLVSILEAARQALADALQRGQASGQVRRDVDCDQAAMFIVAAIEGTLGVTKAYLSQETYRGCLRQLQVYVQSLAA